MCCWDGGERVPHEGSRGVADPPDPRGTARSMAEEAPAAPKPDPPARIELKKRIKEAFKVFDEENNNIADVRCPPCLNPWP